MSQAIWGFIGVVVGVVLTGATQFGLARLEKDSSAKVAARLLMDDLVGIARALRSDPEEPLNGFFLRPRYERLNASWQEYRAVLALILGYADWGTVSEAMQALAVIFLDQDTLEHATPPDVRKHVAGLIDGCTEALTPVAEYHGHIWPPPRMRRKPTRKALIHADPDITERH
jgi:hypothetical protein